MQTKHRFTAADLPTVKPRPRERRAKALIAAPRFDRCASYQQGDEIFCPSCGLRWGRQDPRPPCGKS